MAMNRPLLRNQTYVAVVADPADNPLIIESINKNGNVSRETLQKLTDKAFSRTAIYDSAISD